MVHKRLFPLLVFFALLLITESAIALIVYAKRPADIPVSCGIAKIVPPEQGVDLAAIDAFMVENLRQTGLAGAILAISGNDQILYTAGYGYTSDGLRITADIPMPIASLTKSFTAAAIMLLSYRGRDRIEHYLPFF
jgi:CubicO group peptidase (beta-lactamase class C family)